MKREVQYSREALDQFDELHNYIAARAGQQVADGYLQRLLAFCDRLGDEPVTGRDRGDLLPGLLTATFERRRVVLFTVIGAVVHVLATGIYHGAREWEAQVRDDPRFRQQQVSSGEQHPS